MSLIYKGKTDSIKRDRNFGYNFYTAVIPCKEKYIHGPAYPKMYTSAEALGRECEFEKLYQYQDIINNGYPVVVAPDIDEQFKHNRISLRINSNGTYTYPDYYKVYDTIEENFEYGGQFRYDWKAEELDDQNSIYIRIPKLNFFPELTVCVYEQENDCYSSASCYYEYIESNNKTVGVKIYLSEKIDGCIAIDITEYDNKKENILVKKNIEVKKNEDKEIDITDWFEGKTESEIPKEFVATRKVSDGVYEHIVVEREQNKIIISALDDYGIYRFDFRIIEECESGSFTGVAHTFTNGDPEIIRNYRVFQKLQNNELKRVSLDTNYSSDQSNDDNILLSESETYYYYYIENGCRSFGVNESLASSNQADANVQVERTQNIKIDLSELSGCNFSDSQETSYIIISAEINSGDKLIYVPISTNENPAVFYGYDETMLDLDTFSDVGYIKENDTVVGSVNNISEFIDNFENVVLNEDTGNIKKIHTRNSIIDELVEKLDPKNIYKEAVNKLYDPEIIDFSESDIYNNPRVIEDDNIIKNDFENIYYSPHDINFGAISKAKFCSTIKNILFTSGIYSEDVLEKTDLINNLYTALYNGDSNSDLKNILIYGKSDVAVDDEELDDEKFRKSKYCILIEFEKEVVRYGNNLFAYMIRCSEYNQNEKHKHKAISSSASIDNNFNSDKLCERTNALKIFELYSNIYGLNPGDIYVDISKISDEYNLYNMSIYMDEFLCETYNFYIDRNLKNDPYIIERKDLFFFPEIKSELLETRFFDYNLYGRLCDSRYEDFENNNYTPEDFKQNLGYGYIDMRNFQIPEARYYLMRDKIDITHDDDNIISFENALELLVEYGYNPDLVLIDNFGFSSIEKCKVLNEFLTNNGGLSSQALIRFGINDILLAKNKGMYSPAKSSRTGNIKNSKYLRDVENRIAYYYDDVILYDLPYSSWFVMISTIFDGNFIDIIKDRIIYKSTNLEEGCYCVRKEVSDDGNTYKICKINSVNEKDNTCEIEYIEEEIDTARYFNSDFNNDFLVEENDRIIEKYYNINNIDNKLLEAVDEKNNHIDFVSIKGFLDLMYINYIDYDGIKYYYFGINETNKTSNTKLPLTIRTVDTFVTRFYSSKITRTFKELAKNIYGETRKNINALIDEAEMFLNRILKNTTKIDISHKIDYDTRTLNIASNVELKKMINRRFDIDVTIDI